MTLPLVEKLALQPPVRLGGSLKFRVTDQELIDELPVLVTVTSS
jgi:hypothetical protein